MLCALNSSKVENAKPIGKMTQAFNSLSYKVERTNVKLWANYSNKSKMLLDWILFTLCVGKHVGSKILRSFIDLELELFPFFCGEDFLFCLDKAWLIIIQLLVVVRIQISKLKQKKVKAKGCKLIMVSSASPFAKLELPKKHTKKLTDCRRQRL